MLYSLYHNLGIVNLEVAPKAGVISIYMDLLALNAAKSSDKIESFLKKDSLSVVKDVGFSKNFNDSWQRERVVGEQKTFWTIRALFKGSSLLCLFREALHQLDAFPEIKMIAGLIGVSILTEIVGAVVYAPQNRFHGAGFMKIAKQFPLRAFHPFIEDIFKNR